MDADIEKLIPTLEADTANRLPQLTTDIPGLRRLRAQAALATEGTGPAVKSQEDIEIPGPKGLGTIPLRVFVPNGPVRGAYLSIHGGGWVLGSERSADPTLRRIASEAGVAVVSVGYRLAPEHPYPAGLDDCMAAAEWLENQSADFGVTDPGALAIGGDSAGGNLAAAVLLRRRDEGQTPFRAAIFTYGVFTAKLDLPSMKEMWDRDLVLSGPIMQFFVDAYVNKEQQEHPYVSPLYADLKGMPPALFQVGTLDHLYSDTIEMANAWRKAGNVIELREFPGAPHGFAGFPVEAAKTAIGAMAAFIARNIG